MVYGKRAASSLYALRETLKRRRDLMGTDSPTHAAMLVDPEFEDDAGRDLEKVVVEQSLSARAEKEDLKAAIRQLDVVLDKPDLAVSKWPRMVEECLAANGILPGNGMQVVVFTEFADTAEWLVARFRAEGYSAERYSGRDPDAAREAVRQRFAARDFQVIVSTDAGNEGIDLQTAHVLVNWDIPWSLVRLEQRMGRIHRVGQTRDVELYNLVATGTKEGQVLEVLLTNFVVAANQLDGKMFDSLSLLAELVNLDFEQTLARTFDSPERAAAALATAKAASSERLAAAARRAAAEEDALRSAVDIAKAVAALQEETLERINPRIVEAFLERLSDAGLLKVKAHAAGPGIFVVSAGQDGAAPISGVGQGPTLVATSGSALENARAAGADVSHALPLGPSDPAFRGIVDSAAQDVRPALFEGGRLVDRTSVTDYTLFAYEADVAEFGGQRRSTWPFLVRVDDMGSRSLRWEWLANLEPGDRQSSALHPGRVLDADQRASDVVAIERSRRGEVLDAWMTGAVAELERLPSALTSHIDDPAARVGARKRVEKAVENRLAELRRMAVVDVGEPRRLGWAAVTAAGAPLSAVDADSEEIAMRHVASLLKDAGWSVADVHLEPRGYDLLARKGRDQRSIEVKGVWDAASSRGVRMTGHELLIARQLGEAYWLYVVDQCQDGAGHLFGVYQDPADRFEDLMKDSDHRGRPRQCPRLGEGGRFADMRMIERWFPCAEVSEASESGWGSGKSEKALFIWFAARPLAQAKAAVLTSLLPWPNDVGEQERLKKLVREAMSGRDAAHDELVAELRRTYPNGASMLDPFSGRAMIPLEAARLGVKAWGIDYSPVATLAGTLLADYPASRLVERAAAAFRSTRWVCVEDRLVADVERVLDEVGRRYDGLDGGVLPEGRR